MVKFFKLNAPIGGAQKASRMLASIYIIGAVLLLSMMAGCANDNGNGNGNGNNICDTSVPTLDCDGDGVDNNVDEFDNDAARSCRVTNDNRNSADVDCDNDGMNNGPDNCPAIANPRQEDNDDDADGDACDLDDDGDGLIEVRTLEELNSIRFNLAGTGFVASAGADANVMGCGDADGDMCNGYELMNDLDFDTNGDGSITAADGAISYDEGKGWLPIGLASTSDDTANFTAIFDGNDNTISNLFIARNATRIGLFRYIGRDSTVRRLNLVNARVSHTADNNISDSIGPLAGQSDGAIIAVSATGGTTTGSNGTGGADSIGGLVGIVTSGSIIASYATGTVTGGSGVDIIGGLIGSNLNRVAASYATGAVNGGGGDDRVGGLVGLISLGGIAASYAIGAVNGGTGDDNVGGLVGFYSDGTIAASYATSGTVDGGSDNDSVGALIGAGGSAATVTASYGFGTLMNVDTPGIDRSDDASNASAVANAAALTVMNSSTATPAGTNDWSTTVWDFTAGQNPALKWITDFSRGTDLFSPDDDEYSCEKCGKFASARTDVRRHHPQTG